VAGKELEAIRSRGHFLSKGQDDLFRSRLDQIIDMSHELVRLAGLIDWQLLGGKLGEVYSDGPGQPPLPTRLMAGLAILKHTFDLSDGRLFCHIAHGIVR
jgi:transposase, IS5 family